MCGVRGLTSKSKLVYQFVTPAALGVTTMVIYAALIKYQKSELKAKTESDSKRTEYESDRSDGVENFDPSDAYSTYDSEEGLEEGKRPLNSTHRRTQSVIGESEEFFSRVVWAWMTFAYLAVCNATLALLLCVEVTRTDGSSIEVLQSAGLVECGPWQWPLWLLLVVLVLLPLSPLLVKVFILLRGCHLPDFNLNADIPDRFDVWKIMRKNPVLRAFTDVVSVQFKLKFWYWGFILVLLRFLLALSASGFLNSQTTPLNNSMLVIFCCLWSLVIQVSP
jgi:hypothetical protein